MDGFTGALVDGVDGEADVMEGSVQPGEPEDNEKEDVGSEALGILFYYFLSLKSERG